MSVERCGDGGGLFLRASECSDDGRDGDVLVETGLRMVKRMMMKPPNKASASCLKMPQLVEADKTGWPTHVALLDKPRVANR
jgi:hypothetical protein